MTVMDSQVITIEQDTLNAQIVKSIVLEKLLNNKVISEEVFLEYCEKWQIIIIKGSWFEHWVNKFRKKDQKDHYNYKYVKFED